MAHGKLFLAMHKFTKNMTSQRGSGKSTALSLYERVVGETSQAQVDTMTAQYGPIQRANLVKIQKYDLYRS